MTGGEDLAARVRLGPYHERAGIELLRLAPGEVEVALTAAEHDLNAAGLVHGGVIAGLADTACGLAVRAALEPGLLQVTAQLSVAYLAPAPLGRIVARGRALRVGRRAAYAEADVEDGGGTLLARAAATFVVLPEARGGRAPAG